MTAAISPKPFLNTFPPSLDCELARFLLKHYGIEVQEEPHSLIFSFFRFGATPITPVIVNQTFVRQNLERETPLGRHLHGLGRQGTDSEITGVAGDAKDQSLRREINATVYVPQKQESTNFEVRTASNPSALIPAIRDAVSQIDSNLPVFGIKTQAEQIERSLFQERLIAYLSSSFGGLSLILSSIGLLYPARCSQLQNCLVFGFWVTPKRGHRKLSQNWGSLHGFENRCGEPHSETIIC